MASSSLEHSPCVEVSLQVSPDIINHPLGFVIDSGGSLTKLVYRSKEDYKDGKPLRAMEQGVLRLKSFTIDQLPSLAAFIKANVDMALTPDHKDVCWWNTGVTSKFFKAQLDKDLNIKTKLYSEMMGLTRSLEKQELLKLSFHQTCPQNIAEAAKITKDMLSMMTGLEEKGEDIEIFQCEENSNEVLEDTPKPKTSMPVLPPEHYLMQLVDTEDYQSWIEQHLKQPSSFQTPSLFLLVGSAGHVSEVNENYKFKFIDFSTASGKTMCALAEEMVGEKDFDKFIQLAEEGDSRKVDMSSKDLNVESHKDDDWYSVFPEDMVVFEMGKLCSNNYNGKGTYSKADLAAGLLSLQLHTLSKMLISCVRISRVFRVYVCGSMFQFPHVRKTFESHFYKDSMMTSIQYGEPFKVHFFNNPGYLVSLGVWMQNVQEEKDREALKSLAKI